MSLEDRGELWDAAGLRQFQVVRCVVESHRGRFGVDVELTEPVAGVKAFIDFVLLPDPRNYPPVGTVLEAVTVDFMPWGELRLDASESP
ncbi:hypothetical protein [Lentzea sp. NPDC051838]|uniref:hypothetical protein n=1 Tax=Lentzea sp. NPDC051838 TaxID=3154849 RepID=UPI0034157985